MAQAPAGAPPRRVDVDLGSVIGRSGTVRGLAVLGGGTVLAALFGLAFQALLAYWFGAGAETDAFFMSLSIYGFLGKLLMLTHLRAIALPTYARFRARDPTRARGLAGGLVGLTLLGSLLLAGVFVLGAPVLVDLLAPGYRGEMRDLTALLVRVRVAALPCLAATTIAMALLEAEGRFGVTISAQKVVPAVVSLALLLLVADRAGIVAVGWVGLAATLAGAMLLIPAVRPLVGPLALRGALRDPELRTIGGRWVRLSGSNAATFVGEWAFRVGASLLPIGLFSAVLYGRMVHDLLHAAINDSAQTVALPRFAAALATGPDAASDRGPVEGGPSSEEAERRLGASVRAALAGLSAVALPLTLFVIATAPWSVALLFGRGRFLADGMLRPAAVSLSLFMVGFLIQGPVQMLFAGAFAAHRSDLVNRVQLIGHLARAAALVPMVRAFSYVGLVGAQIAMNLLVLALLLWWSPAPWALRRPRAGGLLRWSAVGAVPLALYLTLVAPQLPDPLAVGTVGRASILLLTGAAWFVLHAFLALACGLAGAAAMRARVRRLAGGAVGLAVLLAGPARAAGQGVGHAPLPDHGWTLGILEWLEARGRVPVGSSAMRPLAGSYAAALIAGDRTVDEFSTAALERLEVERVGRLLEPWLAVALGVGATDAAAGARGEIGLLLGRAESRPFGFVDLELGERSRMARGGVGIRGGGAWVSAGRERLRLGGAGTGALVLNPAVALDGVIGGTAAPLHAPVLGEVALVAGVGPMNGYEAVEDPWWAFLRGTANPVSWLQLGLSRAVLAGGRFEGGTVPFDAKVYGPDSGSATALDALKIALGISTPYDDHVAALDVRASLAPLGVPVLAYFELGWEDRDRSWGDPAVLLGVLAAPEAPLPLAVRYEYVGFGAAARFCAWCDTLPAYWYQHTRFQSGWRVGDELLGHPLGGYGRLHLVEVAGWGRDGRLEGVLRRSWIRRDRWNLLEPLRPGFASRWEARASWRPTPRLQLEGRWEQERGSAWSRRTVSLMARGFL